MPMHSNAAVVYKYLINLFMMSCCHRAAVVADMTLNCCSNRSFAHQELSSQLESQGKVDPTSFQALVTMLGQQNLASAEEPDVEQYQSQLKAWEAEKRQLIQREKDLREKAEQERRERLAAKAAEQQA
ncbi:hypothetical protein GOODEAATRI_017521 [Goodea atripinnis]|uniref:Uncharacterized protein n=1 Tax=Goodea atripinnis TaxID=208336 RepID=A0ABV0NX55_9TELE